MNRAQSSRFFLYLIAIIAVYGAMLLAKGGLYIDRHEGDTLHLIDIVRRMGMGQWPHLDFMTPLGIAAFLPMSILVQAGFGVGTAVILAQIGVAVLLLPAVFYVARSRFDILPAYAFGAVVLIMVLALVHGESADTVSISMHYNRWAWAFAFLAIPLAVLPARAGGVQVLDGLVLGLAMSFFILGKVTFAVSFAPALVLGLVLRRAWGAMWVGLAVVAICAALPTALFGITYWSAYVADLLLVSGSEIRARAGEDWNTLLLAPRFLVGNLVLAACAVLLRKSDQSDVGLLLIVLAPGFFYVTYQNFGNDPKWLALLAFLMAAVGADVRYRAMALVAAALIAPSFLNMAVSPFRNLMAVESRFEATFDAAPHTDVNTRTRRANWVLERHPAFYTDPAFEDLNTFFDTVEDISLIGVTYSSCERDVGMIGVMREMGADLRAFGLSDDAQIFTAGTLNSLWMFGGFAPLKGGAPWYYGALSGFENADYLVVPTCINTYMAFKSIAEEIDKLEGVEFEELRSTELYRLYRINR